MAQCSSAFFKEPRAPDWTHVKMNLYVVLEWPTLMPLLHNSGLEYCNAFDVFERTTDSVNYKFNTEIKINISFSPKLTAN